MRDLLNVRINAKRQTALRYAEMALLTTPTDEEFLSKAKKEFTKISSLIKLRDEN